jgi:hypothetical protein
VERSVEKVDANSSKPANLALGKLLFKISDSLTLSLLVACRLV